MVKIDNSASSVKFLCSKAEAQRHLDALDPLQVGQHCFQTFDDTGKNPRLARILTGTLDEHFAKLAKLNALGAGVYVAVNEQGGPGRSIENTVSVRAQFADLDGAPRDPVAAFPLRQRLQVETSPGKFHTYMLATNVPLGAFEPIQKKLAELWHGDRSVHDLPRVARLAGFWHRKDPDKPFRSRIVYDDPDAPFYSADDFAKALEFVALPVTAVERESHEPAVDWDIPSNVEWARTHLAECKASVTGEHGDNRAYKTAALMREHGISEPTCIDLMLELYDPRCNPPDADWIETKVRNAYKYAQAQPGSATAEHDFAEPAERVSVPVSDDDILDDSTSTTDYGEPLTVSALLDGTYPRTPHLIEGLILQGLINLLYGDGGIGKTTTATQMGVAVAAGAEIFGCKTIKSPVLLVLAEDDEGEVKPRIAAMVKMLGIEDPAALDLRIWCLRGPDISIARITDEGATVLLPFYHTLSRKLAEKPGSFVVLDSLVDIAQMGESQRLPANAFFKRVLTSLARKHKATLLVLGHPSKASMRDGTWYSGSTAYRNAVRNMLVMKRIGKTADRLLAVLKANYGPENTRIRLTWCDDIFVAPTDINVAPAERNDYNTTLGIILDMIKRGLNVAIVNQGAGQTPRTVADRFNEQVHRTPDCEITWQEIQGFMRKALDNGDLRYVKSAGKTPAHFIEPASPDEFTGDPIVGGDEAEADGMDGGE